MKYFLFDLNNIPITEADDIKTALQIFGEVYDKEPDAAKDYVVQIFLEISPGKIKFYNCYYLPDFLNKSPEFFEATPEQEDAHAEKEKTQEDAHDEKKKAQEKPKLMTKEERKAFNAGNNRAIDEMAQGFTDEEMAIIIKYVPTGFIIGELARRLQEYDNATNEIQHILSNMKIYQSDKKGM